MRDMAVCSRCGSDQQIEEHHIVELCHGGSDTPENKEYRCRPCHKYEHAKRAVRAARYYERKRRYNKERIGVYDRRLEALVGLNTPELIRGRGTYLSYWSDSSLHKLPRRVRSKAEEAADARIDAILKRAMEEMFSEG